MDVSSSKLTYNPSSGTLSATVFTSLSDENEKTNIKIIENSTEKLNQLNGVTFEWVDTNTSSAGVIAQQVEKVLPELILDVHGKKTVNYNGLIGFLIEGFKETQKEIQKLKESNQ